MAEPSAATKMAAISGLQQDSTQTSETTLGNGSNVGRDEENLSSDFTENEVKLFSLTPCNTNTDTSTPFSTHRPTLYHNYTSSTDSPDNIPSQGDFTCSDISHNQSITIASSGDLNEQRRQVNLLCNSFSELAVDFDTKLCKSFEEIVLDIDQITNMIRTTPSPKPPLAKTCSGSKPVHLAESKLDLTLKTGSHARESDENVTGDKIDKILDLVEQNKVNIKLLTGKLCSLEAKTEEGLSTCLEKVGSLEKKLEKEIARMNSQLDSTFEYMDTRVDTRMDMIFGAKCLKIDNHFADTFKLIDTRVTSKVNELLAGYNKDNLLKLEEVQAEVKEIRENSVNRSTMGESIRPIIDEYLDTKEFNFEADAPLTDLVDKVVRRQTANINTAHVTQ